MSKLATIERIDSVKKHPNADRLKICKVKGWQVITASDVQEGDEVVYIETDTIAPTKPEFSFLEKVGYRIKTIRLRGEISNGLIMPLSVAFGENLDEFPTTLREVGMDVTELVGVKKYEKPLHVSLGGTVEGNFPAKYCPMTDEIRIQKYPELLNEIRGKVVVQTLKIDGTSSSFIRPPAHDLNSKQLYVCGRTLSFKKPEDKQDPNIYWRIAKELDLEAVIPDGVALQGEIAGPNIQGNPYKLEKIQLFVFSMWDTAERKLKGFHEMEDFCGKHNIPIAPSLGESVPGSATVEEWVERASKLTYNGVKAEGMVVRPIEPVFSDICGGYLSFKVINQEYALEHGE